MTFIDDQNIIDYVKMFQDLIEQGNGEDKSCQSAYQPLANYFVNSDKHLVDLLFNLLQFNPCNRHSAAEALKNPIFDKIRNKNLERPAKKQIYLEFDQKGCYDYESGSDKIYSGCQEYRDKILRER